MHVCSQLVGPWGLTIRVPYRFHSVSPLVTGAELRIRQLF